ncbi:rhomboid family intramembrane serine protease [Desulfogranum mediterraneum]|uniref:rhomboid family intramembrane serine protease n=1 Tax=Desulfogranum mediterraneum TaxID=160661 RepID=UPI000422169B|nr:rhomboid family intramembrane serine protease [Desulfogranum mediterraneum]
MQRLEEKIIFQGDLEHNSRSSQEGGVQDEAEGTRIPMNQEGLGSDLSPRQQSFMESQPSAAEASRPVVIASGTPDQLASSALVLLSKDIEHELDQSRGELLVSPQQASAALYQLESYRCENKDWPPCPDVSWQPPFFKPWVTLTILGLLAIFFGHTGSWQSESLWFQLGAINRDTILVDHQWWRLVTALTLHADLVHLSGNLLIGGHLILLLSRTMGFGLSWLLVLLSGTAGNLINILVRDQQHLSVGFSTAVFATIGIFTGLRLCSPGSSALRQILLPLGAGLGLLVFLGSAGANTDIGAHFFGFICGILVGMAARGSRIILRAARARRQLLLLITALLLPILCWLLALYAPLISPA